MCLIDLHFLEVENLETEEKCHQSYLYREMHGCTLSLISKPLTNMRTCAFNFELKLFY